MALEVKEVNVNEQEISPVTVEEIEGTIERSKLLVGELYSLDYGSLALCEAFRLVCLRAQLRQLKIQPTSA